MLGKEARVCCIIDGLDECSNTVEDQVSFINRLSALFHAAKATTRLAVISRLDKCEIRDPSLWMSIQIQSSDVQEDIENFVSTRLEGSLVLNQHTEKDRLLKRLVESSDGMILWAELMIKELEAGHWNVDGVLSHPPRGLEAVYAVIFRRLSTSATITEVQYVLQLLLVAARPLRLDELAMGLALLKGLRNHQDYTLRGNPDREGKDIIRRSSPLLTIMPDKTVQLAHASLKEFLLEREEGGRDVLDSASEKFCFKLTDLHSTVASCLITYLSLECFKLEGQEEGSQAISFIGSSLLEYSTLYLMTHSIQSPPSAELARKLVLLFDSASGWQWLQRLVEVHGTSFGHLQIMQSQLKSWSKSPYIDDKYQDILGGFLLILAQQRYEDSKVFPAEHKTRLAAMCALADCYVEHGIFYKGEELEIQVMEMRKRVLGADHPHTLTSMSNLTSTYRNQGRWTEAEELDVQVMEMRKRVLGAEHPDTLTSMSNLASTYWDQGRWTEAEELDVQVMEMRKRVLGAEHPNTLTSMSNLASTYMNQGRWTEAEELNVQVMEMRKRVLGAEHPHTLASMHNLASTYENQGRWTEAEELNVQVMEIRKRVLGVEHPDTLISMSNLAYTYKLQDRHDAAVELMKTVVDLRIKNIGATHPDTLDSVDYLNEWSHT